MGCLLAEQDPRPVSRQGARRYVVASWSDQGLHTRGTLEGFKRIASKHKWLRVHGRKKWQFYYEPRTSRTCAASSTAS